MWLSGVKIHILTKKPMKHAHIKNRSVPNYLEHHAGTKLPLFNEENEHSNESEQQRASQNLWTFLMECHTNLILTCVIKLLPSF